MGKIIGFAGKGESGKSTAAAYLVLEHGFTEFNFADPLKKAAAALIGEDLELYYDHKSKAEIISWLGISRRTLMQLLGTECVRDRIADDFWTRRMEHDIFLEDNPYIVIGDVRFVNEARMIKDLGGIIVLLERDAGFASDHASEQIDFDSDITIFNNEDLQVLFKKLDKIVGR